MKNISKKGALNFLQAIIILTIVFFIFFFYQKVQAGKISDQIEALFKDKLDTGKTGSVVRMEITKEAEKIYDSISNAFESTRNSERCIVQIDEFSKIEDSTVVLGNVDDGTFLRITDKNGRIPKSKTIYGIHPCIIAGKNSTNFYNLNFKNQETGKEYADVLSIIIHEKEIIIADGKEYSIEDNDCCTNNIYTNNKKINVLYKPDKEHICFITTKDGDGKCDADEKGVDDDCISDGDIFLRVKKC